MSETPFTNIVQLSDYRPVAKAGVASVPLLPPSIAAPIGTGGDGPAAMAATLPDDPGSAAATLMRFKEAMEILRTVCEGRALDEDGAARALRYFERTEAPKDEGDVEEAATFNFLRRHGLSFDWIFEGDASGMIAARIANRLRGQGATQRS